MKQEDELSFLSSDEKFSKKNLDIVCINSSTSVNYPDHDYSLAVSPNETKFPARRSKGGNSLACQTGDDWYGKYPIFDYSYHKDARTLPLDALLMESSFDKVCLGVPAVVVDGKARSISFLIGRDVPVGILRVDKLGSWSSKAVHTQKKTYRFAANGCGTREKENAEYTVSRTYFKHPAATPLGSLRKIIWTAFDKNDTNLRSLITYKMDDGVKMQFNARGSAKKLLPLFQRILLAEHTSECREALSPSRIRSRSVSEAEAAGDSCYADQQQVPRNTRQNLSAGKFSTARRIGSRRLNLNEEELMEMSEGGFVHILSKTDKDSQMMSLTSEHLRTVMLYCFDRGLTAVQARKEIQGAYGEGAISERTCRIWFSRFREGIRDVTDRPRSGRPHELDSEALQAQLDKDPTQSSRELAEALGVSHATVLDRLHEIGKVPKLGRWETTSQTPKGRTSGKNTRGNLDVVKQRRTKRPQRNTRGRRTNMKQMTPSTSSAVQDRMKQQKKNFQPPKAFQ